jgi:ribosomal peptide maturation radical SAM protein 1
VQGSLPLLEEHIAGLLEEAIAGRDWSAYDVVGFTTTFEQNLPSLALAARIKQRAPGIRVVFGGANCDDEMGPALHEGFAEIIDHVVVGEGEESFPDLVEALRRGADVSALRGVTYRDGAGQVRSGGPREPMNDLDASPVPDFSDYLDAIGRSGLPVEPRLPFEASRGCWWGVSHLCTFCGLNQARLAYRSKSPSRILSEITSLAERHGCVQFNAVDNILDVRYFKTVLPALVELRREHDLDFFFEVKANLRKEQILMMREAGILAVQPGIESFSDRLLRLMDKGCTGIQNVQTLKWLHECDVVALWGLLTNVPGERPEDYEQMIRWIPSLEHLPPPTFVIPIELHRFSPYFTSPASFGVQNPRTAFPYSLAYRTDERLLGRIAYVYDYDHDLSPRMDELRKALSRACERWFHGYQAHVASAPLDSPRVRRLTVEWGPGFATIYDGRSGPIEVHRLGREEAALYVFCDQHRAWSAVEARFGAGAQKTVDALAGERLLLQDPEGRVLSLATRLEQPRMRVPRPGEVGHGTEAPPPRAAS